MLKTKSYILFGFKEKYIIIKNKNIKWQKGSFYNYRKLLFIEKSKTNTMKTYFFSIFFCWQVENFQLEI
jgi:hypothetical protein